MIRDTAQFPNSAQHSILQGNRHFVAFFCFTRAATEMREIYPESEKRFLNFFETSLRFPRRTLLDTRSGSGEDAYLGGFLPAFRTAVAGTSEVEGNPYASVNSAHQDDLHSQGTHRSFGLTTTKLLGPACPMSNRSESHLEAYAEGILPSFRPAAPEQESTVNELKSVVAKQREQITARASQIQKMSNRLELSEGAPRIVASNP
jgi:hypothetical protein